MRITIGAHKGGCGKTTSAVLLAWLLAEDGTPTVLIDGDRQQSALTWRRESERYGDQWPAHLTFQPWRDPFTMPPPEFHAVIDTGPGDPTRLRKAAGESHLTVIATTPLPADVAQVGATVTDVERAGCPLVGVLLTQVRAGTTEARAVPQELRDDDVPALDTIVPWSVPRYARAFGNLPTRFHIGAYRDVLDELLLSPVATHVEA